MTRCALAISSGRLGKKAARCARTPARLIGRLDAGEVLLAALLHHEQASADALRAGVASAGGHGIGKEARALAAAEHQQRERPAASEAGSSGWPSRPPGRAPDCPSPAPWRAQLPSRSLVFSNEAAMTVTCLRKRAVGAAQHRVLLVQRRRDLAQARSDQRREGRIAAEADHGAGLDLAHQPERGGDAAREHPAPPGRRRGSSGPAERGRRDAVGRARGKAGAVAVAAHVGDEIDGDERRPSSCASAKAGNRWPPVPPAASMTDWDVTDAMSRVFSRASW